MKSYFLGVAFVALSWIHHTLLVIGAFTVFYISTHEFYWELGQSYASTSPQEPVKEARRK